MNEFESKRTFKKASIDQQETLVWIRINLYGPYAVHSIELIDDLLFLFLFGSENIYFKMFIFIFIQVNLYWFETDDQRLHYHWKISSVFINFHFKLMTSIQFFIHASNRTIFDCPPDAHDGGLIDKIDICFIVMGSKQKLKDKMIKIIIRFTPWSVCE